MASSSLARAYELEQTVARQGSELAQVYRMLKRQMAMTRELQRQVGRQTPRASDTAAAALPGHRGGASAGMRWDPAEEHRTRRASGAAAALLLKADKTELQAQVRQLRAEIQRLEGISSEGGHGLSFAEQMERRVTRVEFETYVRKQREMGNGTRFSPRTGNESKGWWSRRFEDLVGRDLESRILRAVAADSDVNKLKFATNDMARRVHEAEVEVSRFSEAFDAMRRELCWSTDSPRIRRSLGRSRAGRTAAGGAAAPRPPHRSGADEGRKRSRAGRN